MNVWVQLIVISAIGLTAGLLSWWLAARSVWVHVFIWVGAWLAIARVDLSFADRFMLLAVGLYLGGYAGRREQWRRMMAGDRSEPSAKDTLLLFFKPGPILPDDSFIMSTWRVFTRRGHGADERR
jgi:hypothetical protein